NDKFTQNDYNSIMNKVENIVKPLRPNTSLAILITLIGSAVLGILFYLACTTNTHLLKMIYIIGTLLVLLLLWLWNNHKMAKCIRQMEREMKHCCDELDVLYKSKELRFYCTKAHEKKIKTYPFDGNFIQSPDRRYDACYFCIYG
ncbi:hypothetical protein HDV01_002314, partial [Terramyces sp. JEL0728]